MFKRSKAGNTLLEIIVSISIVTLILVAFISAITVSLANAQYTRNKAQAGKYAQEAIEWLRNEKENMSWGVFYNKSLEDPGQTYCLTNVNQDLVSLTPPSPCLTTDVIPGTVFTRTMVLTGNGYMSPNNGDRVKVDVTVSWSRSGSTTNASVTLNTYIAKSMF